MMKDRKLATRYARALLATMPDPSTGERVVEFLLSLAAVMRSSRSLREALEDPATPRTRRLEVLQSLARRYEMPETVLNFLAAVVENGRVPQLPSIGEVFRELWEQQQGIVPATITSAAPLSDDLRARARASLERLTRSKVRLTCEVEPSLIGGAVTRIGSTVYDGSLRTQLANLRRRMAEE